MAETFRLLCFGDNHGNAESLRRVVEDTAGETFDHVVHTGDLTNLFFDGEQAATAQIEEMTPHLEALAERGQFVYVLGNRDRRGRDRILPGDVPVGTRVPSDAVAKVGDLSFVRSMPSGPLESPLVRVTHFWEAVPPRFDGLLSLSGHTHNGRTIGNIVDTGFLYRTDDHGGEGIYGGYYVIEVDTAGDVDVEFRPIGDVEERECDQHAMLGERFVTPTAWTNPCPFCYEEADYYNELRRAVLSQHLSAGEFDGRTADDHPITEGTLDAVEDAFPRPFLTKERSMLVTESRSTGQTTLDEF
ncbi:MAG: metallophosphoesterase [Halolamina sp.]